MPNELETSFETIPDDIFSKLMDDAPPANQPSADKLPAKPATINLGDDANKEPDDKSKEPKDKEPKVKTDEEHEADLNTATGAPETSESTESVDEAEILKSHALGLIERGIWEEFEGMEEFEYTTENYGRLVEQQAIWKAEGKYADRIEKVGDIGQTILNHIEQGGDPNEIIDLFKASKRIETFDIKTQAGKESLIKEYYTKVVGWPETKTNKYIKSLVDEGEERVTEEATEAQAIMLKGIQAQQKATQEAAVDNKKQQEAQAKAWEATIRKTIKDKEDIDIKEKRELEDALMNYNIKLPDGRVVNKFMIKFMEMQADPKKYIDLVRYVTNAESFNKKAEKKVESQVAKKNWEFIKGNQSLSKSTGTSHSKIDKSQGDLTIDYRKLLSNI